MVKKRICAFIAIVILISCHRHKEFYFPGPTECHISSISSDGSQDFYFSRDTLHIYKGKLKGDYKLVYDTVHQHGIVKGNKYINNIHVGYTSFAYDNYGNRIADTTYTNTNPSGTPVYLADSVINYTYNQNSQIVRSDAFNIYSSPSHCYYIFAYNSGKNIAQKDTYDGSGTLLYTVSYTYDTKKFIGPITFSLFDPVLKGQNNDIISALTTGGTTAFNQANSYTASFTFDTDYGFPMTEIDSCMNGSVKNRNYEFVCFLQGL